MSSPLVGRAWSDGRPMIGTTVAEALGAFRDLPLPVRMRAAAEVVKEARQRFHDDPKNDDNSSWVANTWTPTPTDLIWFADTWEREAAHDAEKEKLVEELAKEIRVTVESGDFTCEDVASALIDAGWRKGTGDE